MMRHTPNISILIVIISFFKNQPLSLAAACISIAFQPKKGSIASAIELTHIQHPINIVVKQHAILYMRYQTTRVMHLILYATHRMFKSL